MHLVGNVSRLPKCYVSKRVVCASKDRKLESSTTSPPYSALARLTRVLLTTDVSQSIDHSDVTHNCYEHIRNLWFSSQIIFRD